jgi:RNA polymerase sigma factor (sigma-70 family)
MNTPQDGLTEWMNAAGRYPILPKDQVIEISRQIQESGIESKKGKKLINKLVLHNLRLVVAFVHPFMNAKSANKWGSPESVDYLQVGTLGLFKAAEKFDPSLGYAFSTYANYWIRSFVGRYNMKMSSPLKISEEALRCLYMFERYGHLSEKSKVGAEWKKDPEKMCKLVKAAQSPVSIYAEMESGNRLIDSLQIEQPKAVGFYENSFAPYLEYCIESAELTEIEDKVIRLAFIDDEKPLPASGICGVSVFEYTNIKKRALRKIKKAIPSGMF